MKCTKCGYEEEVPRWLIDELFPNEPEENYMMHCPECDHKMIVKNNSATKRQIQNVGYYDSPFCPKTLIKSFYLFKILIVFKLIQLLKKDIPLDYYENDFYIQY